MVLLPKWVGVYIGIGLVEVIWNLCTSIIINQICYSVNMYDSLHVFRQGVGIREATMEEKLNQHLEGMCHEPLSQVFLYV